MARYAYPRRLHVTPRDGFVVLFGDLHCRPLAWREADTPAMATLMAWLDWRGRDVTAFVCMGDALDGATIGKHPPLGWEQKPMVAEEIAAEMSIDVEKIRHIQKISQEVL
jgi:hypothetical protein